MEKVASLLYIWGELLLCGDKYYISGNVDSFISEPGDRLDGAVSLYLKSA